MEQEQLACGIWKRIEDGITRYEREHGEKPFALILHSADVSEFCQGAESDDTIPDSMAIIQNPRFELPTLIDHRGNPYEIRRGDRNARRQRTGAAQAQQCRERQGSGEFEQ